MSCNDELCKSCLNAQLDGPIPYDDLDPEMVELVKTLNLIPGMRTLDSCFGHSGSGDPTKQHQDYAFVGLKPTDLEVFTKFWSKFFHYIGGKFNVKDGFVQYTMVQYPFDPYRLIRLQITCQHDPAIDPRGVQEKKDAIDYLVYLLKDHLQWAAKQAA